MIYSMSRDEVLPFSKRLRKVSTKGGATVNAAVLVGVCWRPGCC
jgi:amino acid transporter